MNLYEIRYNRYKEDSYDGSITSLMGRLYQIPATSEENALVNFGKIFCEYDEIDIVAIKLVRSK